MVICETNKIVLDLEWFVHVIDYLINLIPSSPVLLVGLIF